MSTFFLKLASGVTLAAAFSLSLLPTAGHAYTPEEQQACQPDAFRLCGSEIPDVDRITACMIARKSQLSPECRKFFQSGEAAAAPASAGGKPMNIKPAATHKPNATKGKKTTKPAAS